MQTDARASYIVQSIFIHSFILPLTTYEYINNVQEIYNILKIIVTILTKLFTNVVSGNDKEAFIKAGGYRLPGTIG